MKLGELISIKYNTTGILWKSYDAEETLILRYLQKNSIGIFIEDDALKIPKKFKNTLNVSNLSKCLFANGIILLDKHDLNKL
mgnify:CR=1 FL=1